MVRTEPGGPWLPFGNGLAVTLGTRVAIVHVVIHVTQPGQRANELTERLTALAARRQELAIDQGEALEPLSDEDLRALQAHVREVIEGGDPPARKALLQALSTRSGS